MILKFIFDNEIHRCSAPVDFSQLQPFLANMFRSSLPSKFYLYYVTPEGENAPLETSEDYQTLMSLPSNKPIKVVITEKAVSFPVKKVSADEHAGRQDYEVMSQPVESKEKQVIPPQEEKSKEEIPLIKPNEKEMSNSAFDKLINDIAEVHVMPKLQEQQGESSKDDQIKNIVKATLQEQMPFIISQIKEAFIQEGVFELKRSRADQYHWNQYGYQPLYSNMHPQPYGGVNVPQENRPNVQQQGQDDNNQEEGMSHYLNKAKEFIGKIPGKANELVTNLTHKMEGDPLVDCPEGKYRQSTVDKVGNLREWFPEENKKDLLDFVEKFSKEVPLDQLADIYVSNMKKADQ